MPLRSNGTVLGSEATSLAPFHMTYDPLRPIALSRRIMDIPCRAAMAPWLLLYLRCPKSTLAREKVKSLEKGNVKNASLTAEH